MKEEKSLPDIEALLKNSQNLSDEEKQKLAEAINEALKKSAEAIAELSKARKVNPKVLHDEFTL